MCADWFMRVNFVNLILNESIYLWIVWWMHSNCLFRCAIRRYFLLQLFQMPISLYRYLIGILHLFVFLLSINYRLIFRYIEAQLSCMRPKWTYAVYLCIKFVSDRNTISWSNCLCSQIWIRNYTFIRMNRK